MGYDPIDWITIENDFSDHPKTLAAQRLSGLPLPTVVGAIVLLWMRASRRFPDGKILADKHHPADLLSLPAGEAEALWSAMLEDKVCYLEREGDVIKIHGWEERVGKLLSRRRRREKSEHPGEDDKAIERPREATDPSSQPKKATRRKAVFRGDLAGDPDLWKRLPRHPSQCGYTHLDPMDPRREIEDMKRMGLGLKGEFRAYREFFMRQDGDKQKLLVAYQDERLVDSEAVRLSLKASLELAGSETVWAAICSKVSSSLPAVTKFLAEWKKRQD